MNDAIGALFNDRSDSGTQAHHAASGPVQMKKKNTVSGVRGVQNIVPNSTWHEHLLYFSIHVSRFEESVSIWIYVVWTLQLSGPDADLTNFFLAYY